MAVLTLVVIHGTEAQPQGLTQRNNPNPDPGLLGLCSKFSSASFPCPSILSFILSTRNCLWSPHCCLLGFMWVNSTVAVMSGHLRERGAREGSSASDRGICEHLLIFGGRGGEGRLT